MDHSNEYPTFGSFGVISGVKVKISEKFLPPPKVSLPVGFKAIDPTDLLQFQYNFSKEKEAIALAEEERLNQIRQIQEREEEAGLLEEQQHEQQCLVEKENERVQKEEEELRKQLEKENENDYENIESKDNTPEVTSRVSEILTPQVVTDSNTNQTKQNKSTIDVLEFESQNNNPFELVELQTLNEFDELRSVLDPTVKPTPKSSRPKSDSNNSGVEFELSSLFFKSPTASEPTSVNNNQNTGNIISITEALPNALPNVFINNTFGSVPQQPNMSTESWTHFDVIRTTSEQIPSSNLLHNNFNNTQQQPQQQQQTNNNEFKNHIGNLLSKTPPPNAGYRYTSTNEHENSHSFDNGIDNSISPRQYENISAMHRTKSLPNLAENADYENADNVTLNRSGPTSLEAKYSKSSEQQQQFPTGRIESIMKQYNFQRMSNSNNNQTSTSHPDDNMSSIDHMKESQYSNPIYSLPPTSSNSFPTSSASFSTQPSSYGIPHVITTITDGSYATTAVSSINHKSGSIPLASSTSNQSTYYTPSSMPQAYNYVPPYMSGNINSRPDQFANGVPPLPLPPIGVGPITPHYPANNLDVGGPMLVHSRPTTQPDWLNGTNLSNNNSQRQPMIPPRMQGNTNIPLTPPKQNEESNQSQNISAEETRWRSVYPPPSFGSPHNTTKQQPTPFPRQPVNKSPKPGHPVPPPRRPKSACLVPLNTNVIKQDMLNEQDLKTSPTKPLPTISNHFPTNNEPNSGTVASSLLPDQTPALSTSEKNFARQLNAMGFPLPLVSRAIKRLGMDEREVLDFLVLVQEIKESGHNGDDVEMALVYNENDKAKTKSYLDSVSMFKEYGFQAKNIHEALKETSCDQHKALDILTR